MAIIIGVGIGTLLLAAAMVYGVLATKRRNRANDRVTSEATTRLYDDETAYATAGERDMRGKIKAV